MLMRSISARFDGDKVMFDEPVTIRPQTRLLVTILEDVDPDRDDFLALAAASLAGSYDEDEVEYTEADVHK